MLPALVKNPINPGVAVDMKKQQLRESVAKYRLRQEEQKQQQLKESVERIKAKRAELQREPTAGERLYQNIDAFGAVMDMRTEFMKADRAQKWVEPIRDSLIPSFYEQSDDLTFGTALDKILFTLKRGGDSVQLSSFYIYGGEGSGAGGLVEGSADLVEKLNLSFDFKVINAKTYYKRNYGGDETDDEEAEDVELDEETERKRKEYERLFEAKFPQASDLYSEWYEGAYFENLPDYFEDYTVKFTFPTPQSRDEAILLFTTIERVVSE